MLFRKRTFLILFMILSGLGTTARAQATPQFDRFPAGKIYNGKNAPAIIDKDSRTFRTRVRWSAKHGKRNFAGEYILAQFGCGAWCRATFALNARTGRVVWLPFSICCWTETVMDPTEARLNSRLLVLRGLRNEGLDEYAGDSATDTHYYQIKNGVFRHVKTVK